MMQCPHCNAEIEDGLIVCSQCNRSLKKAKTKPKAYWLATLSAYCILVVVAVYMGGMLIAVREIEVDKAVGDIVVDLSASERIGNRPAFDFTRCSSLGSPPRKQ